MGATPSAPVLVLFFNRPGPLAKVLERVQAARPTRVYLACDGPRPNVDGEHVRVSATRELALSLKWHDPPATRFLRDNAGCARAVSEAITWFFGQEPEGIILEDDCVPDPSFFRFATELLARYRDDDRVMSIDGTCFDVRSRPNGSLREGSYAFARSPHVWGWASWARAWKHYRLNIDEADIQAVPRANFPSGRTASVRGWTRKFRRHAGPNPSTWDYQWALAHFRHGGLVASPARNLVTNVRTDGGAHMQGLDMWQERPLESMQFPLAHPAIVDADAELDLHIESVHCNHRPWAARKVMQLMMRHRLWKPPRPEVSG